jgi:hypothetical protein
MKTFAAYFLSSILLAACWAGQSASAAIVASGFFSGTLERFDPTTGTQSTFSTIASPADPFPGLSGVAYNPRLNLYYVTARISSRVYVVDGTSGSVVSFRQLASGTQPASVAVGADNSLYVADNGSNNVLRLNTNGTTTTYTLPDVGAGANFPSGLAFDGDDLIVSTFAGAGLFRLNPSTGVASPIGGSPLGNGQVAISDSGTVFAGGAAFTSNVASYDLLTGVTDPSFITIDATLLPEPLLSFTSQNFTSPSGIAIDADGNLIVAALGRTNPTSSDDNFQNNGGVFKFAPDGSFIETIAVQTTPFSSVVVATAIPEPSSMLALAVIGTIGAVVSRKRYARGRKKASTIS